MTGTVARRGLSQRRARATMPQDHRVARPDGDAVHQQLAQLGDDARGEVLRAGRRAGVDDHQVVRLRRFQHAVPDGGIVVGQRRQTVGQPAPLVDHRAQHQRVILDDVARAKLGARRYQFGARGLDRHHAAGGARCKLHGPQPAAAPMSCGRRR